MKVRDVPDLPSNAVDYMLDLNVLTALCILFFVFLLCWVESEGRLIIGVLGVCVVIVVGVGDAAMQGSITAWVAMMVITGIVIALSSAGQRNR